MNKNLFLILLNILFTFFAAGQQDSSLEEGFWVKPYLQHSTKTSMVILWETKEEATTLVEYGEAQFDVEEADISRQIRIEGYRQMHEVLLEDLKPESNYFWRAVSETQNGRRIISETYSFKTTVNDSSAFMFALVGDSQWNRDTPWAWSVIAEEVWKERPSFIVHAGDLIDWGPKKTDWTEHFFPGGQALMARVPMYTVLGNHEGDSDLYYQYMANPKPEYRYHFKYGNAEFFMIDSNRDLSEGSEQYNWLDQALAKSTATWKIAVHHHPPYSSESDDHGDTFKEASTMGTQSRNLVPLFDKYNVDFSLFGHTHVYERTWPLKNNRINQKNGTVYINSGGAGGFIETFAPTRNWFTLELQQGHHFCTFAVYDKTLIFKAIDYEGRVFDSFQMTKPEGQTLQAEVIQPPAPIIESERFVFQDRTAVTIQAGLKDLIIHYTLDGSEPGLQSPLYTSEIVLEEGAELKARSFTKDGKGSRVSTREFEKMIPFGATKEVETVPGLRYQYYEGDWRDVKANYFISSNKKGEGILKTLNIKDINGPDKGYWGLIVNGYFEVPQTDTYTFYALDSRGLQVSIDGILIVDSDGEDQTVKSLVLEEGKHSLVIKSYQHQGRKSFSFGFYDSVMGRIPFRPGQLSH